MGTNAAITITATASDPYWAKPAHGHAAGNIVTATGIKAHAIDEATLGVAMVTASDAGGFYYTHNGTVVLSAAVWAAANDDGENLQPGEFYFLSSTSQGKLTKTAPTTGFIQPIGFAISETEFVYTTYQPTTVGDETLMQANAAAGQFRVGNMLIQWGAELSVGDDDQTITFPTAYDAGTTPTVTSTIDANTQTGSQYASNWTFRGHSNTGFISNRHNTNVGDADAAVINWFAAGVSTI